MENSQIIINRIKGLLGHNYERYNTKHQQTRGHESRATSYLFFKK